MRDWPSRHGGTLLASAVFLVEVKGKDVTEEIKNRQTDEKTKDTVEPSGQPMDIKGVTSCGVRTANSRPRFNRYLYENYLCNLESQIETWNRRAVRDPNPASAHALWHKAEGLGYALRLLYAFEPEFSELVEAASLAESAGLLQR